MKAICIAIIQAFVVAIIVHTIMSVKEMLDKYKSRPYRAARLFAVWRATPLYRQSLKTTNKSERVIYKNPKSAGSGLICGI